MARPALTVTREEVPQKQSEEGKAWEMGRPFVTPWEMGRPSVTPWEMGRPFVTPWGAARAQRTPTHQKKSRIGKTVFPECLVRKAHDAFPAAASSAARLKKGRLWAMRVAVSGQLALLDSGPRA